jgi:hypothetical protein
MCDYCERDTGELHEDIPFRFCATCRNHWETELRTKTRGYFSKDHLTKGGPRPHLTPFRIGALAGSAVTDRGYAKLERIAGKM